MKRMLKLSSLLPILVAGCGGVANVTPPNMGTVAAESAHNASQVNACVYNYYGNVTGAQIVNGPYFTGLPFTENFWWAQVSFPHNAEREIYIDDADICNYSQVFADIYPFKYSQGRCQCSDGSTETCAVSPPSKNHDDCNNAVKCACQACWNKGKGPGSARGCS